MATAEQAVEKRRNPSFWDAFIGKRIVVQTKGPVIITGRFVTKTKNDFIVLEEPTITGRQVRTAPPQVFIDRSHIGHFHEECAKEKVAKEDSE